MFDDRNDPVKRENNSTEEEENCRSNVLKQVRAGECIVIRVGLRWAHGHSSRAVEGPE